MRTPDSSHKVTQLRLFGSETGLPRLTRVRRPVPERTFRASTRLFRFQPSRDSLPSVMNPLSTLLDNGDMTATPAIGRCCCGKVEVTLLDGMPKSGTHCRAHSLLSGGLRHNLTCECMLADCKNCRTASGGVYVLSSASLIRAHLTSR